MNKNSYEISAITDWGDNPESGMTFDDFILSKSQYPGLYEDAIDRGVIPIEQLSPKGLALLTYLYAEKDKTERQPVIASTINDFKHVVGLVADAPVGTKLTVILQLTDWNNVINESSYIHKTVCQLEKTKSGIQCIHMDSVSDYQSPCYMLLFKVMNAKKTEFTFYKQSESDSPEALARARQKDRYQCGVFAFKDARHLCRDDDFLQHTKITKDKNIEEGYSYELPPLYLKGVQSRAYSEQVLSLHGESVVTRTGKTLRQVHEKHKVTEYINHFSQKYYDMVSKFVNAHLNKPDFLKKAVEKYDARSLTTERLIEVYGPKSLSDSQLQEKTQHLQLTGIGFFTPQNELKEEPIKNASFSKSGNKQ